MGGVRGFGLFRSIKSNFYVGPVMPGVMGEADYSHPSGTEVQNKWSFSPLRCNPQCHSRYILCVLCWSETEYSNIITRYGTMFNTNMAVRSRNDNKFHVMAHTGL